MSIAENIASVRERMDKAMSAAGRRDDVKLIAVTKTVDVARVNEAIEAGITAIGENRVQELLEKRELLLPVEQHLIGSLQTNKAKYVTGKVALIHSLDRLSLAAEIDRLAALRGVVQDVLVEVNIGGEEGKGGVSPGEVLPFFESIEGIAGIRVKGLMAVPPICKEDEARRYFSAVRKLFDAVAARGFQNANMRELSMGMSGDFEAAILEGASMVRVGSALFGTRR